MKNGKELININVVLYEETLKVRQRVKFMIKIKEAVSKLEFMVTIMFETKSLRFEFYTEIIGKNWRRGLRLQA